MLKNKKFSKVPVTELNKSDRKVLDRYTKSYSNYIESGTAKGDASNENSHDHFESKKL